MSAKNDFHCHGNEAHAISVPPMLKLEWFALYFFGFGLLVFTPPVIDPDLWGHIKFGLDYYHLQTLPTQDSYSFTAENSIWFHHDWLRELTLGIAWATDGMNGLWMLRGIVLAVVLLLILQTLKSGTATGEPAELTPACVFIALLWSILYASSAYRPQLATILFFTMTARCLLWMDNYYNRQHLLVDRNINFTLPHQYGLFAGCFVAFVVWSNFHGGWIAGIGIIYLWLIARTIYSIKATMKPCRILEISRSSAGIAFLCACHWPQIK